MGRVFSVDWGSRRLGLAVSDETRFLARPLPTLVVENWREAVDPVIRMIREFEVDTVVVGDPVHMSGGKSATGVRVRNFSDMLEKALPGVRIVLWDERLTTIEASAILHRRGERIKGRKGRLDQVAAALLLQSFLDSEKSE